MRLDELLKTPIRFKGVLCLLNVPSTKSPSGAEIDGVKYKTRVTYDAAKEALPTLIGAPLNYRAGLMGHNLQQECGKILQAWIHGNKLEVYGEIYSDRWRDIAKEFHGRELGMSFDVDNAHYKKSRYANTIDIHKLTFIGAAIMQRSRAAYTDSRFFILSGSSNVTESTEHIKFLRRRNKWLKTLGPAKSIDDRTNQRIGIPLATATQGNYRMAVNPGVDIPLGTLRQGTVFITNTMTKETRKCGYWMDCPEDGTEMGFSNYSKLSRKERAAEYLEDQKKYGYKNSFEAHK